MHNFGPICLPWCLFYWTSEKHALQIERSNVLLRRTQENGQTKPSTLLNKTTRGKRCKQSLFLYGNRINLKTCIKKRWNTIYHDSEVRWSLRTHRAVTETRWSLRTNIMVSEVGWLVPTGCYIWFDCFIDWNP